MLCKATSICDATSSCSMSSTPLPEAARLQKPQDYKETFKVSSYVCLRMQDVFSKNPQKRTVVSEYADPCKLAASESFKCLERYVSYMTPLYLHQSFDFTENSNDYDRDACLDYFRAYRECKAAWVAKRKTIV